MMSKKSTSKPKGRAPKPGLRLPEVPGTPKMPKQTPRPRPADSGCSTGTGWKQYKDLLRGKR